MERLVDQACGIPESLAKQTTDAFHEWQVSKGFAIKLECCLCHSVVIAGRDKGDPKQAVKAVFPCPKCWPDIKPEDLDQYAGPQGQLLVKYFDRDGNEVQPSWQGEG